MFTLVQSAATKLAAHASRSVAIPVKPGTIIERYYGPKLYGDVVGRLRAIESRDHTFLSDVRSAGRRVFGKAKEMLTKRNQTHSISASDESFCSPGSLDDDEMEIPVNLIFRRSRVRNRRNACIKASGGVECIYIADSECSYGPRYEYEGPCDNILEEIDEEVAEFGDGATTPSVLETGDATVRALRGETQAGDDADIPDLECDNAARPIAIVNHSNTSTASFPVSPFFCSPMTESTLAPPTPSGSESGPHTPRSMPVLVYESDSYEEALFAEFNAIIDKRATKAANERVE